LRISPFIEISQTKISYLNRLTFCSWATGLPEIATGESKSPFFGFFSLQRLPTAPAKVLKTAGLQLIPLRRFYVLTVFGVHSFYRENPTSDTLSQK